MKTSEIDVTTHRELISRALKALTDDCVLIHPTDTIPGLTFDPRSPAAWKALCVLKGRDATKSVLCLAHSIVTAKTLWSSLPDGWDRVLHEVWPGPLSIVWQASSKVPKHLLAGDGTIGIRVPKLAPDDAWFFEVLGGAGGYLPTTSINFAGKPPAQSTADVARFVEEKPAVVKLPFLDQNQERKPSTVIRLRPDSGYDLLRLGDESMLILLKELAPARSGA